VIFFLFSILFYLLFYFISFSSPLYPNLPLLIHPGASCITLFSPFLPLPPPSSSSSSSWTVCCATQPLGMHLESRTPLKAPHPNACKMGLRTWKGLQATGRVSAQLHHLLLRLPGLNAGPRTVRARNCSKAVSPKPKTCPRGWHSIPKRDLPPSYYTDYNLRGHAVVDWQGPNTLIQKLLCQEW